MKIVFNRGRLIYTGFGPENNCNSARHVMTPLNLYSRKHEIWHLLALTKFELACFGTGVKTKYFSQHINRKNAMT